MGDQVSADTVCTLCGEHFAMNGPLHICPQAPRPAESVVNGECVGERHGWPLWINVTCVECPSCGFTFDADHEDVGIGGYTCTECNHQSEDGA